MKLTDNQIELAVQLRALSAGARIPDEALAALAEEQKCPQDEKTWAAFIDLTRLTAVMLDGVKTLPSPPEMQKVFDEAWNAYAHYFGGEYNRVLRETLGSAEMVEKVRHHPNGAEVINRILARARDAVGPILPGVDFSQVSVDDILQEAGIL